MSDTNTPNIGDIAKLIDDQGRALEVWQESQSAKMADLESIVRDLTLKAGRPSLATGPAARDPAFAWFDTRSKRQVKVYRGDEPIAPPSSAPSIGRLLRGIVLGGKAHDAAELEGERKALGISPDPSGGYTVTSTLAEAWIDKLRAAMVLTRAGALTVPMTTGELTLAKITGDPTVSWRAENADITAVEPTFGAVTLRAKTCVCLLRMSLELAQDSANIERLLGDAVTAAMANAIDAAGLVGVTSNANAAPGGIFDMPGRNTVTSVGAPANWDFVVDGVYELMADNVPQESIGALVAHPSLWRKMRKLKTGIASDNTTLAMPEEVASLPKLWTTAAPTGKAVIANWGDLMFGVRQDITVQPVASFLGSNLQVALLAYARVDFAPARAESFVTLEDITVA